MRLTQGDDIVCPLLGPEGPSLSALGYWLCRFALSLQDVEDLLAERGITVSHETVRVWVAKFGTQIAAKIRRDRPQPADKWHLDEVAIPIRGKKHWLWRAVDGNGDTLEILVQSRRNAKAAKWFLRKIMKRWGIPRVIITDKLRSYGVDTRELCPGVDHRLNKGLNNRSEASHRHTRRREKIFDRFKSARQAQMFLSVHDQTAALFRAKSHRINAADYRSIRTNAQGLWVGYVGEIVA
ncbi:hypothetical protein P775_07655 [Puniceibacterium antarcticum]|uniref:DDE domain-containing protein n=1 Tax=Puniceibacterium antarcticum TaxID=1206336 RepID=A0A2G8RGR7_9RHOB|nr:hypothetical protein P775_07655 [Puniceibacterium antarcticum]